MANLAQAEVKFIVVGGVAVALNGFVRTTDDVDILIERSEENVGRLLSALKSFGAGHARELSFEDFDEAEGAVRVVEDFPLDIFTIMRGHRYAELMHRVLRTEIEGDSVQFLDAEGFIRLKQDSDREEKIRLI